MNKTLFGFVIASVLVIALATAGFVYAQTVTPQPGTPGTGNAYGMGGRGGMMGNGGRGGMMGGNTAAGTQDGLLHDEMVSAFSQKLGISVADLTTRLNNGETMAQIALSKGITAEQFSALMVDVRTQAIDAAVKNGTLTQAQADWMKQRGAGQMSGGRGRGMQGAGQGQFANPECPMYQTAP